jgi:hypothetical protein
VSPIVVASIVVVVTALVMVLARASLRAALVRLA